MGVCRVPLMGKSSKETKVTPKHPNHQTSWNYPSNELWFEYLLSWWACSDCHQGSKYCLANFLAKIEWGTSCNNVNLIELLLVTSFRFFFVAGNKNNFSNTPQSSVQTVVSNTELSGTTSDNPLGFTPVLKYIAQIFVHVWLLLKISKMHTWSIQV